jgi:DnaK suppressor protein
MNHIPADVLEELKDTLMKEQARLMESLHSMGTQDSHNKDNFNAEFIDEGDDLDANVSESTEYSEKIALTEQLERELLDVERALEKMKDGTYGLDEHTKGPIPVDRLRVFPAARTTV